MTQLTSTAEPAAVRPWRTFAMVSVGVFASLLDLFIVNIAFPDLQRDFPSAGLAQLSWVLNGYAVVFAALLVPAGRLVDLYGRKRGFVVGLTAAFVAIVATPSRDTTIAAYRAGWTFMAVAAAVGGLLMLAARLVPARAAAPAEPPTLAQLATAPMSIEGSHRQA